MGYVRRNFLVIPSFESFDALNAYSDAWNFPTYGTIGQRMERDLDRVRCPSAIRGIRCRWSGTGPKIDQTTDNLERNPSSISWHSYPWSGNRCQILSEDRMSRGTSNKREYVQVLRLLETFSLEEVHTAVKGALHLGSDQLRRRWCCAYWRDGHLESLPRRRGLHDLEVDSTTRGKERRPTEGVDHPFDEGHIISLRVRNQAIESRWHSMKEAQDDRLVLFLSSAGVLADGENSR